MGNKAEAEEAEAEEFATDEHGITRKESRSICHGLTRNYTEIRTSRSRKLAMERRHIFQSRMRERRLHSSVGAKPKGSNGVVAVGLPHRNYSVFKQTPYQLMRSKSGGG